MSKALPLIVFGALGHQREIYYLIKQINEICDKPQFDILGFVEKESSQIGRLVCDEKKIIASDETLMDLIVKYESIGAIISQGDATIKEKIYSTLKCGNNSNVVFPNIIHPSVIYNKDIVELGEGNIVAAGTIIASDLKAGSFNLINISCTIGHDVTVGDFNTVNPSVTISGNVAIGNECLIGAGATVLQGLNIGNQVVIGAGAVLTKDAQVGKRYVGVPAKEIIR